MKSETDVNLFTEWSLQQHQYDSYEKFSLLIKLLSISLCSILVFHNQLDYVIVALCSLLWLLDAIWKTFQGRIESRLLTLEKAIKANQTNVAMQYHSEWQMHRGSALSLIKEYILRGASPTVSVPHLVIVGLTLWVSVGI